MMRGMDATSGALLSYVDLEERIPPRHPLRKIRQVVNEALTSLGAEFECLYAAIGLGPMAAPWLDASPFAGIDPTPDVKRVRSRFILTVAANNLARLPRLLSACDC